MVERNRAMYEALFRSVTAKVTLTDVELNALKSYFIPKKIRKRQYLLNAGDVCPHITFVEHGMLRSFMSDDEGRESIVQFATEERWISDMESFFSGKEAAYNIEAIEDSEVLNLSRHAMDEMIEKLPVMERYFRLLMQNHIISLQRRVVAYMSLSAEEKYLKLMDVYPEVITRAPQQYIASYLGITPETLSRIRKQISQR